MEVAKVELEAVKAAVAEPNLQAKPLSDLELALVGGGMGDIIL